MFTSACRLFGFSPSLGFTCSSHPVSDADAWMTPKFGWWLCIVVHRMPVGENNVRTMGNHVWAALLYGFSRQLCGQRWCFRSNLYSGLEWFYLSDIVFDLAAQRQDNSGTHNWFIVNWFTWLCCLTPYQTTRWNACLSPHAHDTAVIGRPWSSGASVHGPAFCSDTASTVRHVSRAHVACSALKRENNFHTHSVHSFLYPLHSRSRTHNSRKTICTVCLVEGSPTSDGSDMQMSPIATAPRGPLTSAPSTCNHRVGWRRAHTCEAPRARSYVRKYLGDFKYEKHFGFVF